MILRACDTGFYTLSALMFCHKYVFIFVLLVNAAFYLSFFFSECSSGPRLFTASGAGQEYGAGNVSSGGSRSFLGGRDPGVYAGGETSTEVRPSQLTPC